MLSDNDLKTTNLTKYLLPHKKSGLTEYNFDKAALTYNAIIKI